LAVALYAAIVWQVLNLWPRDAVSTGSSVSLSGLARWGLPLTVLVYLMILSGGLVAGTDAGFSYPTWPKMGPGYIPPGLYASSPAWIAAFEDVTTIQFNHRLFAYALFFMVGAYGLTLIRRGADAGLRLSGAAVVLVLLIQLTLGISTILSHVAVPVAAAHQGGAILLLTVMLFSADALRRRTS
ncbi:unnamed protein product, partial [Ectocarpus sp. 12 AP-2014]